MKIIKKIIILALSLAVLFQLNSFLCGHEIPIKSFETFEDFNQEDVTIGVMTGSSFDLIAQKQFPKAKRYYLQTMPDLLVALMSRKIDAYLIDEPMARVVEKQNQAITHFQQFVSENDYAFACKKNPQGQALCSLATEFLSELRKDGTLDKIFNKWIDNQDNYLDIPPVDKNKENLNVAVVAATPPFIFYTDNKFAGATGELLLRFAQRLNRNLILTDTPADSLVSSLSKRSDLIAGGLAITEERKELVNFSAPEYKGGIVLAVLQEENALNSKTPLLNSIKTSVERTLIREHRWKAILEGIGITCEISVLSILLGTILGFFICYVRMSKNKSFQRGAKFFINCMRGTPLLIILMIFYYAIFAALPLNGINIAVIAFGLCFSAFAAEIFRTGIEAIDRGQYEAAYALGLSKQETFIKVILPQATRIFIPVFKGESISLIKNTSIVGYIAIQDLTKKMDIIRSHTFEAFFPLALAAVLYFIISYVLTVGLNRLEKYLEPKRVSQQ